MISSDPQNDGEPLDPAFKEAWVPGVRDRLGAYDAGLMEAFGAENVLAEFDGLGDDTRPVQRPESLP